MIALVLMVASFVVTLVSVESSTLVLVMMLSLRVLSETVPCVIVLLRRVLFCTRLFVTFDDVMELEFTVLLVTLEREMVLDEMLLLIS